MERIAHRFGNSLDGVAAATGVTDTIEVDVHLGRSGKAEVRHSKRLWLTGRLWERWYLVDADEPIPTFASILEGSGDTPLWLDLKGFTRRLSRQVASEVGDRRPLTVSTKGWWLLKPFSALDDVRVVRSAGNRFERWLLTTVPSRQSLDAVVLHRRLLSADLVERFHQRGWKVYSWSVPNVEAARRLRRWGVDGVILDDLDIARQLR